MQVCVADLLHGLDTLHELREVLELRPLEGRRIDWHIDFDRFFDRGHLVPFRLLSFAYPAAGCENGATGGPARVPRASRAREESSGEIQLEKVADDERVEALPSVVSRPVSIFSASHGRPHR